MNGLDFYEKLPDNFGARGSAFRPYSHRAQKAGQWIKANALPLLLFTIGGLV